MKKHISQFISLGCVLLVLSACDENNIIYPELNKENITNYISWDEILKSGTLTANYHEQSIQIQSISDIRWELSFVSTDGNDHTWCTPSTKEGNAYTNLKLNFSENPASKDRTGSLKCIFALKKDESGNPILDSLGYPVKDTISIPVLQTTAPTRIQTDVNKIHFAPMRSVSLINLTSNTEWRVEVKDENEQDIEWLTLNRTVGSGNFSLLTSTSLNTTGGKRYAKIIITMTNPNDVDGPKEEKAPIVIDVEQNDRLEKPVLKPTSKNELMLAWEHCVGASNYVLKAYGTENEVIADTTLSNKYNQLSLSSYQYLNDYIGKVRWEIMATAMIENTLFESEKVDMQVHSHFAFESGDGSEENPFLIDAPYQLSNIPLYLDKFYRQTEDLNMEDIKNFLPISSGRDNLGYIGEFTGVYDGDDHAINNLIITDLNNYNVGLFAKLGEGALISNLSFKNCSVRGKVNVGMVAGESRGNVLNVHTDEKSSVVGNGTADYKVGGFFGSCLGNVSLKNCTNKASVGENKIGNNIAGFVSNCDGSLIFENCSNSGVISGNTRVSGFVAIANNVGQITFENCKNGGSLEAGTGGNRVASGFIAQCNASASLNRCFNEANMTGGGSICGFVSRVKLEDGLSLQIKNCFNSGNMENVATATNGSNSANGFIGKREDKSGALVEIAYSHNVGKMSSKAGYADGMVAFCASATALIKVSNVICLDKTECKTTGTYLEQAIGDNVIFSFKNIAPEEMGDVKTFTGWDFNTIWKMAETYPVLK